MMEDDMTQKRVNKKKTFLITGCALVGLAAIWLFLQIVNAESAKMVNTPLKSNQKSNTVDDLSENFSR
jgi:hypothetical protein